MEMELYDQAKQLMERIDYIKGILPDYTAGSKKFFILSTDFPDGGRLPATMEILDNANAAYLAVLQQQLASDQAAFDEL